MTTTEPGRIRFHKSDLRVYDRSRQVVAVACQDCTRYAQGLLGGVVALWTKVECQQRSMSWSGPVGAAIQQWYQGKCECGTVHIVPGLVEARPLDHAELAMHEDKWNEDKLAAYGDTTTTFDAFF